MSDSVNTAQIRDNLGRFLNGNPGKPEGARNKLSADFLNELYEDFKAGGKAAIQATRETKPDIYVRVIAGLLPKEFKLDGSVFGNFTDDQLGRLVAVLDAWLAANAGPGDPDQAGHKSTSDVPALPKANGVSRTH